MSRRFIAIIVDSSLDVTMRGGAASRRPPADRQALRDTLNEDDGDTFGGDDLGLVMVIVGVAVCRRRAWVTRGANDQPLGRGASSRPLMNAAMTCHGSAARTQQAGQHRHGETAPG